MEIKTDEEMLSFNYSHVIEQSKVACSSLVIAIKKETKIIEDQTEEFRIFKLS